MQDIGFLRVPGSGSVLPQWIDCNTNSDSIVHIQIDRFTRDDPDSIEQSITAALNTREDEIAYNRLVDFEQETGYIHYIWDCEVAIHGPTTD